MKVKSLEIETYKKLLSMKKNNVSYKSDKLFEQIEEDLLLNEGTKELALAALLSGIGTGILAGNSTSDISSEMPKDSIKHLEKIASVDGDSGTVDKSKKSPKELIDEIKKDIEKYSERGKVKGASLKSKLNKAKEIEEQVEKVRKVLSAAKGQTSDYQEYQNDPYLKSIWITTLFAKNKLLYQTIGSAKKGQRALELNRENRYKLFYKYTVNDGKSIESNKEMSEIKKECQSHPKWKEYSAMVSSIASTARTNTITVWLTEDLYKNIKNDLGISTDKVPDSLEKVSWCGVMIAGILSRGEIDTKISSFASARRVYKNYIDSEDMAYNHEDFKDRSIKEKSNAIKKVLFVGSIVALYPKKHSPYAQHFAIVKDVGIDNKSGRMWYETVEGNTEGGGGTVYSHKKYIDGSKKGVPEIAQILNLKEIFGSAPKAITLSKEVIDQIKNSSRVKLPKNLKAVFPKLQRNL
jgi:hypothetical protein